MLQCLDRGVAVYETGRRHAQIKHLKWKAATLGWRVIQAPTG